MAAEAAAEEADARAKALEEEASKTSQQGLKENDPSIDDLSGFFIKIKISWLIIYFYLSLYRYYSILDEPKYGIKY